MIAMRVIVVAYSQPATKKVPFPQLKIFDEKSVNKIGNKNIIQVVIIPETAVSIEDKETYFLIFKETKNTITPTRTANQQVAIANPQKTETAFPPLNPANNGQQCPKIVPSPAKQI